MTKALILGHFLPLHNMHLALIHATRSVADEVVFGLFVSKNDAISPVIRHKWLEQFGKVIELEVNKTPYTDIDLKQLPKDIRLIAGSNQNC